MQSLVAKLYLCVWSYSSLPFHGMDLSTSIQRAKEKDPNAFAIIYRTYYPKMVRICMNITREDRATVDDLVHDAFILAFVSIGSLKDNSKFNEWITSIVRNVSLKHLKQKDRIHFQSISSFNEEDTMFMDSSPSPDSECSYKELLELINQLPEGYSKILRLSVIEGFSHKEISEMLGIEPHSSSSQLSRAKRLLRRMIDNRAIIVIAVLLLPIAWYLIFRHQKEQQNDIGIADTKHGKQTRPDLDKSLTVQQDSAEFRPTINISVPTRKEIVLMNQTEQIVLTPDSDSIAVKPHSNITNDRLIMETAEDSLHSTPKDSIISPVIQPEINIAEEHDKGKKKWQFFAAGSLGPALAQGAYNMIATKASDRPVIGSDTPEPDYVVPDNVSTWEDYGKYLKFVSSPDASADTLALIDIVDHNTGEIEQKEHHDRPITFGVSLTKSLGKRWSLETGLQYSMLNSQFSMGENGYSIVDKQKAHYLGIPLRVSYHWINHKHLSAYSSFSFTMHVPVYGKTKSNYLVDWHSVHTQSKHFTPSVQWQTGVGFGLQYKFVPNTSIFVEPTFNWFIPSDSDTHTIWTEHPFMFTCPFGLRITW